MYNIGFMKEIIHITYSLRFWVDMWCLPLLWVWNIDDLLLLPTFLVSLTSGIKTMFGLMEERKMNPIIGRGWLTLVD